MTVRTKSELDALFADNTSGAIGEGDLRDFVDTVVLSNITEISANYTTVLTDEIVVVTAGTPTVTLLTAVGNKGKVFKISNGNGGECPLETTGAETIGGLTARTINSDGVTTVVSDGANWLLTQHSGGRTDIGFFDYNDLATATTPVAVTGGVQTKLTNDGLGTFTQKAYKPDGVTDVWDVATDELDLSDLKLGDQILIRGDIEVTTLSTNTDVQITVKLAVGSLNIELPAAQGSFKTIGTYRMIGAFPLYIGAQGVIDDAGEILIDADNNVDVKVNGWYIRIN